MIRRKQTPISIRSDKAAARLKLLTRDGRSQALVVEQALEHFPLPDEAPAAEVTDRRTRIEAILDRLAASGLPTMSEFDEAEYNRAGDPR